MSMAYTEPLSNGLVALMSADPFYAMLLADVKLTELPAEDARVKTAGTDCISNVLVNAGFVAAFPSEYVAWVLAHEAQHIARLHFFRMEDQEKRDGYVYPTLWNVAGDFVINKNLHDSGYPTLGFMRSVGSVTIAEVEAQIAEYFGTQGKSPASTEPKKGYMLDMGVTASDSTESIYARLVRAIPPEQRGKPQPGDGTGGVMYSDGGLLGGQDADYEAFKAARDALATETGATPEQIEAQVTASIVAAYESAEQRGTAPGYLAGLVADFGKAHVDWRAQVRRYLSAFARDDYSYRRGNRRSAHTNIISPSLRSEKVGHVVFIVDESGSRDEENLQSSLAELNDFTRRVKCDGVTVISCDTRVTSVETFRPGKVVHQFKTGGRGGTDMDPAFAHCNTFKQKPVLVVCFTDGEIGETDRTNIKFPVLWIVDDSKTCAPALPFGRTVFIGDV